jgi:hypothetical protein
MNTSSTSETSSSITNMSTKKFIPLRRQRPTGERYKARPKDREEGSSYAEIMHARNGGASSASETSESTQRPRPSAPLSYADEMTSSSTDIKLASSVVGSGDSALKPVPIVKLPTDIPGISIPKSRPTSPKPIESQHAEKSVKASVKLTQEYLPTPPPTPPPTTPPGSLPTPPPSSVQAPIEGARVEVQAPSVLFAPAEKTVKGVKYGSWTNLKGDPEKLERLNKPSATPLQSRWAS